MDIPTGKFRSVHPEYAEAEFKIIEVLPGVDFGKGIGTKPAYRVERIGPGTHSVVPAHDLAKHFTPIAEAGA